MIRLGLNGPQLARVRASDDVDPRAVAEISLKTFDLMIARVAAFEAKHGPEAIHHISYTALTSGFLHADLPHLIFNMITFWYFGVPLERVIGSARFALLYLAGLLLSLTLSLAKHRDDPAYATLGASGAISAVLFASIVYFPTQKLIILFFPFFQIPAPLFAVGYLAYSIWAARQSRGGINHDAHLAGALVGLLFVALTDPGAYIRALDQFSR